MTSQTGQIGQTGQVRLRLDRCDKVMLDFGLLSFGGGNMPYAAVNRLNMYYEVHGDGPPLLLLHGGSGSIPERWIPFFAARFQVIAIEQMGHGRTADNVDRPFHYHDMAEDTVELMRRLAIERGVLGG